MRQEYKQMLENWVNSQSFINSRIESKTNLSGQNFIDYVSQLISDDDDYKEITFENGSIFFSFNPDFFVTYTALIPNMNIDDVDGFKRRKKVKKGSVSKQGSKVIKSKKTNKFLRSKVKKYNKKKKSAKKKDG